MKTLVVFYSLEGNTQKAAKIIRKELSADYLKLIPVKDVPVNGSKKFLVGGMKATFGVKAKLQRISVDANKYDRIILGTPVWAGKPAPAINTFLSKNHITDKVVAVFTCSGSGDDSGCIRRLKKKLPNMKDSVALSDCKNEKLAVFNDEKLKKFIENYKNKYIS